MKKKFKNLISLFGVSFSFVDPLVPAFTEKVSTLKELFVHTKVEKTIDLKTGLENNQSQFLEEEKTALNKIKVFLIVKTQRTNKQKSEKNNLLLVGVKDQINTRFGVKNYRKQKFFYNMDHTWSKQGEFIRQMPELLPPGEVNPPTRLFAMKIYLDHFSLVKSGLKKNVFVAEKFRGASYLTKQKGSYKSICPVFFDKNSARDFLIENLKSLKNTMNKEEEEIPYIHETILEDDGINIKNSRVVPQDIQNQDIEHIDKVKILCLGLGDFIEYYSTAPNQETLEKVDFLFFPDLEAIAKAKNKKISLKGFKSYQQQLYGHNTV